MESNKILFEDIKGNDGSLNINLLDEKLNKCFKYNTDELWKNTAILWLKFSILFIDEFCVPEDMTVSVLRDFAACGIPDIDGDFTKTKAYNIHMKAVNENPRSKCLEYYSSFMFAPEKKRIGVLKALAKDDYIGSLEKL